MTAGRPRPRRRLLLALLVLVLAVVVAVGIVLVTSTGSPGREAERPVAERPGPVLLVPGYGGSTASLQPLADLLVANGRDATVVALPGNGTDDLNASAEALDQAVTAALERTGEESVDVVGYSAGGLVARLWVTDAEDDVVRRVVTLGSPHHGTSLADLAGTIAPSRCPVACQQMATASALLAGLNARDETPDAASWVSLWTTQDETVTPPESARLEGALNLTVQSVCADARVRHTDLPRTPLVQQMVLAELSAGDPVPLTPADCARLGG